MYICLCHPFSDKKISSFLKGKGEGQRSSVSEVYGACSDGQQPNCCQCLETIKTIVKDHNKTAAV